MGVREVISVADRQLLVFRYRLDALQRCIALVAQFVVVGKNYAVWLAAVVDKVQQGNNHRDSIWISHLSNTLVIQNKGTR